MHGYAPDSATANSNALVSLFATVKNEEASIEDLLKSIEVQTRKPDEVIIVDGGSNDRTVEILKRYQRLWRDTGLAELTVIEKPGANRALGRNAAIKAARGRILVCTDGGCVLGQDFLKNILSHFPESEIVAGATLPLHRNDFEYFQGLVICREPEKDRAVTNMSCRAIAFKKECLEQVGGFPEEIDTADDTVLNMRLKHANFRFESEPKAVVYWKMRPTVRSLFKCFYRYGIGDGKWNVLFRVRTYTIVFLLGIAYLLATIASIFLKLEVFIALVLIGFLYFLSKGLSLFMRTKRIKALIYGTSLFFVVRVGYFIGACRGLLFEKR